MAIGIDFDLAKGHTVSPASQEGLYTVPLCFTITIFAHMNIAETTVHQSVLLTVAGYCAI